MKFIKLITLLLFAICLSTGCTAKVNKNLLDTDENDLISKKFDNPSEQNIAGIYIYRLKQSFLGATTYNRYLYWMNIDGRRVSFLAPRTYVYVKIPEGEHTIEVSVDDFQEYKTSTFTTTFKGGQNYYVEVDPSWNIDYTIPIKEVDEEVGKKNIVGNKCKKIKASNIQFIK
ncbi:MAG: hypothetical protein ACI4V7_06645 [Succinivibrionaceae bacterium]